MSITVQIADPALARMCMLEAKRHGFCEGRDPALILVDLDHFDPPTNESEALIIGLSADPSTLPITRSSGVYDVLSLPFSVREFEEILYRYQKNKKKCVITQENDRWLINGRALPLSQGEARLFALLYRNRDRLVSDTELQMALGDSATRTNTVAVYLYRLRRKLKNTGVQIRTVRQKGCQWIEETR